MRNRINDDGHRDYLVDAGCNVAGTRGCVSMRAASFGKRMQESVLSQQVCEQTLQEHRTETPTPATSCPTVIAASQPAITPVAWLRRSELPSPIWASLVLGRA